MSDKNEKKGTQRKCVNYLYPESNIADKVINDILDKIPVKERGRATRAMMIAGGALMLQEKRIPYLIAEYLDEKTTMGDILRIIKGVQPEEVMPEFDQNALINAISQLVKEASVRTAPIADQGEIPPVRHSLTEEKGDKNEAITRKNSNLMFPE